MNEIWCT